MNELELENFERIMREFHRLAAKLPTPPKGTHYALAIDDPLIRWNEEKKSWECSYHVVLENDTTGDVICYQGIGFPMIADCERCAYETCPKHPDLSDVATVSTTKEYYGG